MTLLHFDKFNVPETIIVLDIETGGKRNNPVILSVGAVAYNIIDGRKIDSGYWVADYVPQLEEGRTNDPDTVDFWERQKVENPNAWKAAFWQDGKPLKNVLLNLKKFIDKNRKKGERVTVWANGPEFDNVIIDDAFAFYDISPGWDYGVNQSVRTIAFLARVLIGVDIKKALKFEGIPHHALHDADYEARQICTVFNELIRMKMYAVEAGYKSPGEPALELKSPSVFEA